MFSLFRPRLAGAIRVARNRVASVATSTAKLVTPLRVTNFAVSRAVSHSAKASVPPQSTDTKEQKIVATTAQVHNEYYLDNLVFRVYKESSNASRRPELTIGVPLNEVIVGGGGKVNWEPYTSEGGSFLIAAYPTRGISGGRDRQAWYAAATDYRIANKASIEAYCVTMSWKDGSGIPDTAYKVVSCKDKRRDVPSERNSYCSFSQSTSTPEAHVVLPDGWELVGGGFNLDRTTSEHGCLVTKSFPYNRDRFRNWEVMGGQIQLPSEGTPAGFAIATAYAIGLSKRFLEKNHLEIVRVTETVEGRYIKDHPCRLPRGTALTCGSVAGPGAHYTVSSYPAAGDTWRGSSRQHVLPSSSMITIHAMGLRKTNGLFFNNGKGVQKKAEGTTATEQNLAQNLPRHGVK
jgi:hypothetical protein